jgi:hypothetical protein
VNKENGCRAGTIFYRVLSLSIGASSWFDFLNFIWQAAEGTGGRRLKNGLGTDFLPTLWASS